MFVDAMIIYLILSCLFQEKGSIRNLKALGYLIIVIACIKFAYFYDNTTVMGHPTPEILTTWKQSIQMNSLLSTYGPILLCFFIEVRVAQTILIPKIAFAIQILCSMILYISLSYLWQIEEGPAFEMARHNGAKFVYIGSFITLLMETCFVKLFNYSFVQFTTRGCFVVLKAMLVLSGHNFQMTILLCLVQNLATRGFFHSLKIKPSTLCMSLILFLTMS